MVQNSNPELIKSTMHCQDSAPLQSWHMIPGIIHRDEHLSFAPRHNIWKGSISKQV